MMSITSSAYCQNIYFRDSVVGHFREQRIKEVSFDIWYSTRDKIQEYGNVSLKGKIKHGCLKLSLEELKETRNSKLRLVRHSFETTPNLENSIIRLVDSLFVTKNIPVIQKTERRDMIEYGDKNKIRVWMKQRGKSEKFEFFFEDYFQTQVIFDSIVTYSSQMISLLKLLEMVLTLESQKGQICPSDCSNHQVEKL
jgi:hypothetical protein